MRPWMRAKKAGSATLRELFRLRNELRVLRQAYAEDNKQRVQLIVERYESKCWGTMRTCESCECNDSCEKCVRINGLFRWKRVSFCSQWQPKEGE